jgi:hypothetical protein
VLSGSVLAGSVLAGCALTSCGVDDVVDTIDVAVLPRVVLDGTVELSDRSGGRVLIEEVVAHAPRARLQAWRSAEAAAVDRDGGDVVVADNDPLLFHYELAERTGFGADIGGERVWAMPSSGAQLLVGFAPYRIDGTASGVDADLVGHTAVVHGSIAIETRQTLGDALAGGLSSGDDVGDADPDGAPAHGGGDDVGDADPDGAPAHGGGDDVGDADPDGAPAHGGGDDVGDADPDGAPAHGGGVGDADPDGAPAHGGGGDVGDADPDGAPAHGGGNVGDADPDGAPARPVDNDKQERVEGFRRSVVRVPFSLVLDGTFHRSVEIDADEIAGVGENEVLPIDLHLSASELFDAQGLRALESVATEALARGEPEATLHVSSGAVSGAVSVQVPATIRRPKRPIASQGNRLDVRGRWRDK